MGADAAEYDDRYLAGILFFNRHDFFEAHEVWEALWLDQAGPERRFYQGLIQAAVGLFHFGNGNLRGAVKLYHTSKAYLDAYPSPYLGLDTAALWDQMARCFRPLLEEPNSDRDLRPDPALLPVVTLDPPPAHWPNPDDFVDDDED
jgi:hypothetical protein